MPTIATAITDAARQLAAHDSPRLDAELLLAAVLGRSRTHLYTWPERELTPQEAAHFGALVARRAAGEPVAHLLGRREFWSLDLAVTPDTLIPRPETERLVELALDRVPAAADWQLADLGTGSGAVALALAVERPQCRVSAVERSASALAVAEANARRAGVENVEFHLGSWFGPLAGRRFALVVSNPPYVRSDDPHLEQGDVRFEPLTALAAGADGLDAIRRLVVDAPAHLEPDGWLLFEHGYDQGEAVRALLDRAGFVAVFTERDIGGQERVSGGRLAAPKPP